MWLMKLEGTIPDGNIETQMWLLSNRRFPEGRRAEVELITIKNVGNVYYLVPMPETAL